MKEENNRTVYVIGHKNPDTDSICSAIAYAHLKREITGESYEARRAGVVNDETKYVLKKFGFEMPKYLGDVRMQVQDAILHDIEGVSPDVSSKFVWELMKKQNVKTIPVLENDRLIGISTTGDIVRSYMDEYDNTMLSKAKTQYKNILDTLDGELLSGDVNGYFTKGKVTIGASSTDAMAEFIQENDLVILSNRYESQAYAIDLNVSCIVVCQNAEVKPVLIKRAQAQGVVIIRTPYDTFTTARLINQSIPVKYFMTTGPLYHFNLDDYLSEVTPEIIKTKIRDFPILNTEGKLVGFISRRRVMNAQKKQVILVDHNEKSQAVDGLEEAEILEIIDHHRLGSIETGGPVYFRNQPVGCTGTIIYQMYQENGVEVPPHIAGILCSAIISDTLLFRSPTCTYVDKAAAEELSKIAEIDMDQMASEMFNAGSHLEGKTADEICFQDFKQFTVGNKKFGVGQINSMSGEELDKVRDRLQEHLPVVAEKKGLDMVFMMLTDILRESSEILCTGKSARKTIIEAFDHPEQEQKLILKGVVSRKKQFVPVLVSAIHH